MKNKTWFSLFLLAAFAIALTAFFTAAPIAHAEPAAFTAAQPLLAQTDPAPAVESGWNFTTIISLAVAFASGLAAIWQQKEATKAQKVARSVILGVEQATKLPQVQQLETRVKDVIRDKSVALGIDRELHALVKRYTA